MGKKIVLLSALIFINYFVKSQTLVAISPNSSSVPKTLTTIVTGSNFFFTTASSPSPFNFYLSNPSSGTTVYPNWINVLDDDHFEANWTLGSGLPKAAYDVIYDYAPWIGASSTLTGGFTIVDSCLIASLPTTGSVCSGDSVKLTYSGASTYQWKLNGVNISGATNSVFYAKVTGAYTVATTGGCTSPSQPFQVTVVSYPSATINPSVPQNLCKGSPLNLQANTGPNLTYSWRKNGTPINSATSSFYTILTAGTAVGQGTYTVVVFNSNLCSATSAGTVVTVHELLSLPSNAIVCQGDSVKLSFSISAISYQWQLNGANISGATASIYYAKSSGSYTVLTTGTACTGVSNAITVTVNALPTASITPSGTQSICKGDALVLSANTGTGLTYQWLNSGTAISGATLSTFLVRSQGYYKIVITNSFGCSSTSVLKTVNVNELPTLTATRQPDSTNGKDAEISSYSPNNNYGTAIELNAVAWTIGGITANTRTLLQFDLSSIPPGSKIYSAYLNLNFDSLTTSALQTQYGDNKAYIQRVTGPWDESTVTWANQPPSVTTNQLLLPASTSSYQDYLNMDVSALVKTMVDSPAVNYGFLLRLVTEVKYRSLLFCSSDYANPVRRPKLVVKYIGASVTASNGITFCSGDSTHLSTASGTYAYQWKNNGVAISGATTSGYYAKASGTYTVKVTGNGGCSVTSSGKVITVNSKPSATITASGPTTFCNGDSVVLSANSGTNFSYQWKKNGNAISGAVSRKYKAKQAGNYSVKVANANGCTKISASTAVSVPCRDEYETIENDLVVSAYPNPASGEFYLNLKNASNENITIRIFNSTGQLVKELYISDFTNDIPVTLETAGFYKLQVIQGSRMKLIALVKTN